MPACGPVRLIAGTPSAVERHRHERRALVLAGREQDVELARVGLVGDGRGEAEQLVGGVAHRGHDDDEVAAGGALARDPARDPLDAVGVGDRRATEFLDDEGGRHRRGILPCAVSGAAPTMAARTLGWHRRRPMCFDLDSRPPIVPIAGGALDGTLAGADRGRRQPVRSRSGRARATRPGRAIVILPDVRGLHPYYEELALRFAENGVDAAGLRLLRADGRHRHAARRRVRVPAARRETTWPGITSDITRPRRRAPAPTAIAVATLFTIGFCMGGRVAFLTPTLELGLAGAIGFYGSPTAARANIPPTPAEIAPEMEGAVLGLFGGADTGIPPDAIATFDAALTDAGIDHRLVSYDGAPHSFFDRKAADFAEASAAAWKEVLGFIQARTP